MDRITAAEVYNLICKLKNLSAVGRYLGISTPMVSRYLKEMEEWAGVRLIHRNSRSLTITTAGEEILEKTKKINVLSREIKDFSNGSLTCGLLRVSCDHVVANHIINPLILSFLEKNQDVRISLTVSNEKANLVEERIDLAIRITNNLDPNLIARKVGVLNSVICASPDYLNKNGHLNSLIDLTEHNCLCYNGFDSKKWRFFNDKSEITEVMVHGNYSTNLSGLLCEVALNGGGVALIPEIEARKYISENKLTLILPEYKPEALEINGLYHSRHHQLPALRVFLDHIVNSYDKLSLT